MVTIDQVRQLESRVAKAIDYVNNVTGENTLLKAKLDGYQKRIDELEVLIQRFKEDQGRIEECIIAALERLNRFEDDAQRTVPPPNGSPPVDKPYTDADVYLEKNAEEQEALQRFPVAAREPVISSPAEKRVNDGFDAGGPEETLPVDPVEAASELDIF
jgi:chromosome segregation ATPase